MSARPRARPHHRHDFDAQAPPPHRHDFDDDDVQWIIYTTRVGDETPKAVANAFDVHWDDIVTANRVPKLNWNSKLHVGTQLRFGAAESMLLCSVCKLDEFAGQPILFCDGQCGRGYHAQCIQLEAVPQGPWLCSWCVTEGATPHGSGRTGETRGVADEDVALPTPPKGRPEHYDLHTEKTGRDGRSRWKVVTRDGNGSHLKQWRLLEKAAQSAGRHRWGRAQGGDRGRETPSQ